MFTVGEFATLAQVSKRLLRYYDEIGLLKPSHTDPSTGYRYYSAGQTAHLNRILVLKELGLSLDQIRRMLNNDVSTDEMQGMLLLKRAEIEQQLAAELQRIRKIEARLQAIHDEESGKPLDVVIKQVPRQTVLSVTRVVETFEAALMLQAEIRFALSGQSGLQFIICHDDDIVERDMCLEIGQIVDAPAPSAVTLHSGAQLQLRELPAMNMAATTIIPGSLEAIHIGYGEIGRWIACNAYRLAGTPRELTLQAATLRSGDDLVTEIQFPVQPLPDAPPIKHFTGFK
jgi:DNA-binding transcriptional MerR regulator